MLASITVLCYVTSYQKKLIPNKNLSIVEASELNLPEFENKDVVLATGNFCIVEGMGQNDEKYSILKITLNDIVRFNTLDPNNLSAFPILINMTALVQEDPEINNKDVVVNVLIKNYVDQDSVIYINDELMITDNDNIVHIYAVSFPKYQKLNTITKNNLMQFSWESTDQNNTNQQNASTIAQTIATRVKGSTRRKKTTLIAKPYLKTNSRPKVTDLANDLLNKPLDLNTSNQTATE
ncbi:15756_t:CDS:2 [Dentiscutata heterogama]|uniref:15756_t:CDS:1 n=1 Tax=Dentiscutata heterogama TaxID=1316150 RepID=A0ACA9M1J0_9GLOM|nr:15756_t:CDS:2 [Dentiscutata heterogama]